MKRILALILVAVLLSVSCIALADEEKVTGFEVAFNFEGGMQYGDGVDSINAFLAAQSLSSLEVKDWSWMFATVYTKEADGEILDAWPIFGFKKITLVGEREDSAIKAIFQFDVSTHYAIEGETWEAYCDQWTSEHPGAIIKWHNFDIVTIGDKDTRAIVICYYTVAP